MKLIYQENKPTMNLGGRLVGSEHSPLVIAEIGINHNGSLDLAIKMVDAAISSGAEVIKHQTHVIEDEMSEEAKNVIPANSNKSIYEIMKDCALSEEEEFKLKEYIETKGAIFLSTPFSRAAVDRLEKLNVSAYKIGSGECNNYPLVEYISKKNKPIILSTGMNTIESIKKSVEIFRNYKINYSLLHCTNVYPTPPEYVRLGAIKEIENAFPDAILGLSDHTTTNYACFGAVALGASILERHFTDKMSRKGPDIECSMDPNALKDLIKGSNSIFLSRGGNKGPVDIEAPTIAFAFASVLAIRDIKKDELLSLDNIWLKRPGGGDFNAENFEDLIGKKAKRDIKMGLRITKFDI